MDELGWLLREERRRRLWTQQKVADDCGLSRQQLSRYETGATEPTWAVFRRILAAYRLQPRIELEPLDADVVAAIERQRSRPPEIWLSDVGRAVDSLYRLLDGLPWQATGLLALRLLGAPTPLGKLEVEVALDNAGWERLVENAWDARLRVWSPDERTDALPIDATGLRRICDAGRGTLRWPESEAWLALRVVERLGGGIRADVGGRTWPVVSADRLEFDDPWSTRVLEQIRRCLDASTDALKKPDDSSQPVP